MSAPGARNPAGSAVPLRPSVARRLAVGPAGNGAGDDRNGQATSAYRQLNGTFIWLVGVPAHHRVCSAGHQDREVPPSCPTPRYRRRGVAGTGPEAGSRPGEGGHGVGGEQPRVLQKHRQPANPTTTSGCNSGGSPRRRASVLTGRRASCGTHSSRSCPTPASRSSRSRMRSATPAPRQPRTSTGTSSGLSCGLLLPRWARCSLVNRTEAPVKFSLPVRLPCFLR